MKKRSPASEVEAFLAARPDVSGVEMLIRKEGKISAEPFRPEKA